MLTTLEQQTGRALEELLYAEEGFSDVTVEDISRLSGIPISSVKGAIGSLVKKKIVWTNPHKGDVVYDFMFLHPEYHARWAKDVGVKHIKLW